LDAPLISVRLCEEIEKGLRSTRNRPLVRRRPRRVLRTGPGGVEDGYFGVVGPFRTLPGNDLAELGVNIVTTHQVGGDGVVELAAVRRRGSAAFSVHRR